MKNNDAQQLEQWSTHQQQELKPKKAQKKEMAPAIGQANSKTLDLSQRQGEHLVLTREGIRNVELGATAKSTRTRYEIDEAARMVANQRAASGQGGVGMS